ncbi:MAG: hypothetical protein WB562_07370 [Candidatus Sulfotelmatobacter sp.]
MPDEFRGNVQLDAVKIKRPKKLTEAEKNRLVVEANERFLKSGIKTEDVYGSLGELESATSPTGA